MGWLVIMEVVDGVVRVFEVRSGSTLFESGETLRLAEIGVGGCVVSLHFEFLCLL